MYIQVRQPLGAIVTINGTTYRIPFVTKIPVTEKEKFVQELSKINADFTISGGRKFPPKKTTSKTVPKKISDESVKEETSEPKDKAKKSNRK